MMLDQLDNWNTRSTQINEMTQAEVVEMQEFYLDLKAFAQGKADQCRMQISGLKDREIAALRVKLSQNTTA